MGKKIKCDCKKHWIPIITFIIGILWFLKDVNVIGFTLPWWPLIIVVLSLGMIFHHKENY